MISPKGSQAILVGAGTMEPDLQYLPENFELSDKENLVFTSGKDGVLFPAIPVGKATLNDGTMSVKLFSDPGQIDLVSIALEQQADVGAR